jgi:hypothetical protein
MFYLLNVIAHLGTRKHKAQPVSWLYSQHCSIVHPRSQHLSQCAGYSCDDQRNDITDLPPNSPADHACLLGKAQCVAEHSRDHGGDGAFCRFQSSQERVSYATWLSSNCFLLVDHGGTISDNAPHLTVLTILALFTMMLNLTDMLPP